MNIVAKLPDVDEAKLEAEPGESAALTPSLSPAPDWERLIEAGVVPALALGAERRTRRAP
jgi:hypothetical protein